MKILRSVTRRGFNVGTAGWFTVLRPNTWFPATRLPRSFHYLGGRPTGAVQPGSQVTAMPLQILRLSARDRRLVRPALIVMAAATITAVLLWWIMGAHSLR
jgi:hypothetical protein